MRKLLQEWYVSRPSGAVLSDELFLRDVLHEKNFLNTAHFIYWLCCLKLRQDCRSFSPGGRLVASFFFYFPFLLTEGVPNNFELWLNKKGFVSVRRQFSSRLLYRNMGFRSTTPGRSQHTWCTLPAPFVADNRLMWFHRWTVPFGRHKSISVRGTVLNEPKQSCFRGIHPANPSTLQIPRVSGESLWNGVLNRGAVVAAPPARYWMALWLFAR
jgi:hypothetical protein